MDKPCPFCKIISREIIENIILETEKCIVVPDIRPINPGHTLIIPKIHESELCNIELEYLVEMIAIAQKIEKSLRKTKFRYGASSIFMECGVETKQEFPHLHLHVIPRKIPDGFELKFPEGYWSRCPTYEELGEIASDIKKNLV